MTKKQRKFKGNNIVWIIFLMILLYFFLCSTVGLPITSGLNSLREWSPAVVFINEYYTPTIAHVLILVLLCLIVKKNRFILRSFLPAGRGNNHRKQVVEDSYEPTQNNTPKMLLLGLLLGFLTNFACIACALAHGDIKLYFDFSAAQLPILLYGLLMVFVQSTSEELWCRGFMYERIIIHYPLWVAVLVNGLFFGLLHMFNDGVTVFAIINIAVCGVSYSLLRWYTGSIWSVMGLHTMWNFTQNFLFGLPNSGLVSEVSLFHMDAASGISNLIYDYSFGVEGAIPSIIISVAIAIVILLLAKKNGRLGELRMSYEKKAALAQIQTTDGNIETIE